MSGTYNENVTVDKALTINGAQARVDARNRNTSNESAVNPSNDPEDASQGQAPTFTLGADNITLNGSC